MVAKSLFYIVSRGIIGCIKSKYDLWPKIALANQQNIANLLKSSANDRNSAENYDLPLATFTLCR
ncbi:hypothetical protein CQJ27_06685 [Escherichia sp. E1130]|nr:hypothetical protein D9738_15775 [Escherichia sp. E10V5]TBR70351.1 hypothetical protein D9737_04595 [Escherichia sp. E10V4]TGB66258.1 hypothetical protein CQB02_08070 [Escherichia coli]TGB73895.1 hypothetical protein CRI66_19945 [Escherichia sp. E4694]TGB92943.1 hypothetical protein CRG94_13115 [Escherichia sp. E3356]TGB93412.1 hypothetical protein CRI64_10920 [Escherichia sp. E2748]TGC02651.1 hypothetical protein CRG92_02635 [Escherichia sp. E2586]TGC12010.1 hypothetical protein CRG93_00